MNTQKTTTASKRSLRARFINLPLRKKFSIITLFLPILTFVCSIIGLHLMNTSATRLLYTSMDGTLAYSAAIISEKLSNVEAMTGQMLADNTIQRTLSTVSDSDSTAARADAFQSLSSAVPNYYQQYKQNGIGYIALYNNNYVTFSDYSRGSKLPASVVAGLKAAAHAKSGSPVWTTNFSNSYGLFLSRDIRRSKNLKLDVIGTVIVNVNLNTVLRDATKSLGLSGQPMYILYDGDHRIYRSPGLLSELPDDVARTPDTGYGTTTMDGHTYFYAKGTVPDFGWQYICLTSYDEVEQARTIYLAIAITLVVFSTIAGMISGRWLVEPIVFHIQRLLYKMDAFGQDNLAVIPEDEDITNREDEIGRLYRQFDRMTHQVQDLIQKNYVNELLTKEAQLKSLENQINPHFLYNTLESINWRAKSLGADEISVMVEALGNLLRTTLSRRDRESTIASELQIVKDYMAILQIRFDDRLSYRIDVPDELLSSPLPKLTLQPLVENAVNYALEEMTETCTISITGSICDENIVLTIRNTGSQFPDNILGKLESGEIKPNGLGIGLLNVNKRIQLQFGEAYGLSFSNDELMDEAIVTMRLPWNKEA